MDNKETVKRDNPAGRLWHILNAARAAPQTGPARNAWASAFEIDPKDDLQLLSCLAGMVTQVEQARRALQTNTSNPELFTEPFPAIVTALSVNHLGNQWKIVAAHLPDTVMTALSYCSEELSRRGTGETADDEEIAQLLSEIDGVTTQVLSGGLDKELKAVVIEQLHAIRTAILQYSIRGTDGLREALKASYGTVFLHPDLFEKHKKTEEIQRFGKILVTLGRLSNAGLKVLASVGAGRLLESLFEG